MTTQKPRFLVWVDFSYALLGASPSAPQPLFRHPLAGKGQNPWSSSDSFSTPKSLGSWPLPLASLFFPSGGKGPRGVGPGGGSCPAPLQHHNPPPESQPSKRRGHLAASTRQVCTPNLGNRTPKSKAQASPRSPPLSCQPLKASGLPPLPLCTLRPSLRRLLPSSLHPIGCQQGMVLTQGEGERGQLTIKRSSLWVGFLILKV